MYLEGVLGSKTKVNILAVLIQNPDKELIESELAKLAVVSVSEVNRQIDDLVAVGLVSLVRVGRSKVYRVNREHFLFEPLRLLFRRLGEVYREIGAVAAGFTGKLDGVQVVILAGSAVSGNVREDYVGEPSDVDLVIVVDSGDQVEAVKDEVLLYLGAEVFPVYGVNVYPIVLTTDEYIEGLSGDAFIAAVHSKGETLYGEKPRRFDWVGSAEG